MTCSVLVAPAGRGKTSYGVRLAQRAAASLTEEVRVCVPTSLQARNWNHRLAGDGAIGVHVLTYDQLVKSCLDAAGERYTEISQLIQYHLLRSLIDKLELPHYDPLRDKPGFIVAVQMLIEQLKAARIDPAAFHDAVGGPEAEQRLVDLAAVYRAYQEKLRQNQWADRVGLGWLAVEALDQGAPDACRDWPLLIVDGFDDFTPIQLALLRLLAGRVGRFHLLLTEAERVAYPRYRHTLAAVEKTLQVTAAPLASVAEPWTAHEPALEALSRDLFARPLAPRQSAGAAVTLREAPDPAAEVRTALRWLKQRIVADGVPPGQVALLARDIAPYRPFVRQIAAEFGLPVRLIDGLPLAQNPAVAALLDLLRLWLPLRPDSQEPSLPRREVVSAWRTPYFAWQDGEQAITPGDADELDRLARQHRVIRGLKQWEAGFAAAERAAPTVDDAGETATQPERVTPASLRRKFEHFVTAAKPPRSGTVREFVEWLDARIGADPRADAAEEPDGSLRMGARAAANPETAEADLCALGELKEVLRGLVWAEAAVDGRRDLTFPTFLAELVGAVNTATYKLPVEPGQSDILVTGVISARGLSFDAVAIMGLSEGSFPTTIREDTFLRDADRERLSQRPDFDLKPSTLSAEREFFYEALSRARRRLLLTRPVLADNGADWVASPFWEEVCRLVDAEPEPVAGEQPPAPAEAASWVEWWESLAAGDRWSAWEAADAVDDRPRIDGAAAVWRARNNGALTPWQGDLRGAADDLGQRYGRTRIWSPSALESYQRCGYSFFVERALRLEPRPEPLEDPDAAQLGSLYHEILEQVYRNGQPDASDEARLREIVAEIAEPLLDAAPEAGGFRETPWWSETRREIIDNVVKTIVALPKDGFVFWKAEVSFGPATGPLVLGDGEDRLLLSGKIDRVDRDPDGKVRIIDYKTAGPSRYTDKELRSGKLLQLPLYALAAEQALKLGPVVDGFYWHVRQGESSKLKLKGWASEAGEVALSYTREVVRRVRAGEFPARPPDGGCPSYCPAAAFCWQYRPAAY